MQSDITNTDPAARSRQTALSLVTLAVMGLHLWLTLRTLSPRDLLADSPILNHDYSIHYFISAQTVDFLRQSSRTWGYDPSLMAGWPSGALLGISSHPQVAGMALLGNTLGMGRAFNWTVLSVLCSLPLIVALAARLLGARPARIALIASALLMHCDSFTDSFAGAGLVAYLLGAALAVLATAAASSYATRPCKRNLTLLSLALTLVVFAHPTAAVAAALPVAVAALSALRQRGLRAGAGFAAAGTIALLVNLIWIAPLMAFSSDKLSYRLYYASSARRALLDLLGISNDAFASLLVIIAVFGIFAAAKRRHPAWPVLAAALAWTACLGYFGSHLGPFAELEPARFLVVLGFSAAAAAPWGLERICWPFLRTGAPSLRAAAPLVVIAGSIILPALLVPGYRLAASGRLPESLKVRPFDHDQAVIDWAAGLHGWGRILIDDSGRHGSWSSWTHLPLLVAARAHREVIAAPFATLPMKHAASLLAEGVLAGKPINAWSDSELQAYINLYGIGWVLTTTAATHERLRRFSGAQEIGPIGPFWTGFRTADGGPFLVGTGTVSASSDRIDVRLEQSGRAVLKYHCMNTLLVNPPGARLGCEQHPPDTVGFITVDVPAEGPLAFRIENGGLRRSAEVPVSGPGGAR